MGPERKSQLGATRGNPWKTKEERGLLLGRILWLVDCLKGPIAGFGIDYPRFRELLRTRVVLMQRSGGESSKAWGEAGAAIAILMTWFAGLVAGLPAILTGAGGLWILVSLSLLIVLPGTR